MSFNPPPNWPIPGGWTPSADWEPDPAWPPAPPGWMFWVDDAQADEELKRTDHEESSPEYTRRGRRRPLLITAGAVMITLAVVAVSLLVVRSDEAPQGIQHLPWTESLEPGRRNTGLWEVPGLNSPQAVDFSSWIRFGGVEAKFSDDRESVILDTHDTTDTWRTKWSGLISTFTDICAARIVGRVRDISHDSGVPGGFGIGLAVLAPGDVDRTELIGTAIQFDFGHGGYRTAAYPSDSGQGLVPTTLDHRWHDIEIIIDETSHTLVVDGQPLVKSAAGGQCGHPVIRVWAGAAEFADFAVGPASS